MSLQSFVFRKLWATRRPSRAAPSSGGGHALPRPGVGSRQSTSCGQGPRAPAVVRRGGRRAGPSEGGSSSEGARPWLRPLRKRKKVGRRWGPGEPGRPAAREPGWSQQLARRQRSGCGSTPRSTAAPPARGAGLGSRPRLPRAAAPKRAALLKRRAGRARHSPGARGRGGRSAPGLSGPQSGALAPRLSAAAGAQGERASKERRLRLPLAAPLPVPSPARPPLCHGSGGQHTWITQRGWRRRWQRLLLVLRGAAALPRHCGAERGGPGVCDPALHGGVGARLAALAHVHAAAAAGAGPG